MDVASDARVCVVIPCYNQAAFLPAAVSSVCAQTFAELEIVIVNDGSTDATSEVARRLIAGHPERHIRLIDQRNQGLPAARNRGIDATQAEYLVCLDADDLLTPDYLTLCVSALDDHPEVSIADPNHHLFGERHELVVHGSYDFAALTDHNRIGVAAMFRRRAWRDVGGYNEEMCSHNGVAYEDWDFWLGCAERGHFGIHVPDAVFYYRVRAGSMYATVDDQRTKAAVVLNHPVLYSEEQLSWARGVIDRDPAMLAITGPHGRVPQIGDPPAARAIARGGLDGARAVTVVALGPELREDPGSTLAWCEMFGATDAVTLAILGDEPTLTELGSRMSEQAAGGDPDLLGIVSIDPPHDLLSASTRVDGFLTNSVVCLPAPLPRYRAQTLDQLRRLVPEHVPAAQPVLL